MITIDGHTFNEDLLSGGWVIDSGCRGFNFSKATKDLGNRVYAIDIDSIFRPHDIIYFDNFKQAALSHRSGDTEAYLFGNGTANFVKGVNMEPGNSEDRPVEKITVPCITLQDIYNEIGTDIDLLKLDIEGSEYEILLDIEPIPKQITVEFHEHCHSHLHYAYFKKVLEHLCKYYHFHAFNLEPRYHYMDCLFIRKDLL